MSSFRVRQSQKQSKLNLWQRTGGSTPVPDVDGSMHTAHFLSRFENIAQPKNSHATSNLTLYTKQLQGATLAFLTGLFALWLTLTIQGIIGLGGVAQIPFSPTSTAIIAAALALMITVAGFPLMLPWILVFFAFEIFAPPNVVFSKWPLCTLAGVLIGIAALWLDAVICCMITSEVWFSLNVPLLTAASIPAAVAGGITCLAGVATTRLLLDHSS